MCGILFGCCLCLCSPGSECGSRCPYDDDGQDCCPSQDIYGIWESDDTISRRGPDLSGLHLLELRNATKGLMRGCVLNLRGKPTLQPVIDDDENALLWNGEIFDGISVAPDENDTQILSNLLSKCLSEEDILKLLQQIHGPWSFIYWQAEKKILWFGRDMYGRRSLLWHLPSSKSHLLSLSSVVVGELEYTEVPSVGIFSINFSTLPSHDEETEGNDENEALLQMTLHPWLRSRWPEKRDLVTETDPKDLPAILKYSPGHVSISISPKQILQSWIPSVNPSLPNEDAPNKPCNFPCDSSTIDEKDLLNILETVLKGDGDFRHLSEKLLTSLHMAIEKRLNNLPANQSSPSNAEEEESRETKSRLAILFSGGLDSSVLAALADRCLPADEPIDLLNVAFEQPASESMNANQMQKHKKVKKNKNRSKDFSKASSSSETVSLEQTQKASVSDSSCSQLVTDRIDKMSFKSSCSSEEMTVVPSCDSKQPPACVGSSVKNNCSTCTTQSNNVSQTVGTFRKFDVPDRRTGRLAYSELCNMNPGRKWNFIEINVTQEELKAERQSRIRKLIYPLCTVLDDSIGCALWFATRGKGKLIKEQEHEVISKAKVILCGMAADEQFAGYSRHRAHFNKFGWEGLISQLQQEMWRISQRNLGRDDRIISDHGREARFPFLDESFTRFISDIPVHMRADLKLPRGVGEKLLLRTSAYLLGFRTTAIQAKRAIQFGSKIAKLDKTNEKGSDVCERLL